MELRWVGENWFPLVQTLGIVTGLLVTGQTLRSDLRSRRITDHLALAQLQRDLWDQLRNRPELLRILEEEADLVACPVTVAERDFLNSVFVHYINGWMVAQDAGLLTLEALSLDVRGFFGLPIPHTVWKQTQGHFDPKFVAFIEECLKGR